MKQKKTLLVSYNRISGFPQGKYEDANVIVLSAESGRKAYYSTPMTKLRAKAESVVSKIGHNLEDAIKASDKAVVYVGLRAIDGALNLAQRIAEKGKKVRIVGCTCDYSEKSEVAKRLKVPYETCECGGESTMGRIAKQYQK